MRQHAAALAALVLLAGCGGTDGTDSGAEADGTRSTSTAAPSQPASAPAELGTIVDSGFGQRDEYVWAGALVHNNSDYVGQTVTVNFNVLDAGGAILASQSQVENFSRPQADHVIGTQIDLNAGETAAKVEASLLVEPAGAFSDKPFPEMQTGNYRIGTDEYGAPQVSFEVTNPLDQPLSAPRIGILCRDRGHRIIGGSVEYPDLVPAGGTVRIDSSVIVPTAPAACSAVVGSPIDWDGVTNDPATDGTTGSTSDGESDAAPAASGTAEAAFKTWLDQFAAQDWDAQYGTLLTAQQNLISKQRYKICRTNDAADVKYVKTLSVQDVGPTAIPGTDQKLPSTKVTVQVSFNGVETPVDAHMYAENGQWRWSMTQENLDNCA